MNLFYLLTFQARSHDFSWGGGGGCACESWCKALGGSGGMLPRENLDCLRLHFARFHSGESEDEEKE